jgi:hypothetical protein
VEAIPSHTLLPCRPVRGMPSRSVHRVMGSVPHNPAQPNPPRMGRRPQKQPSRRGESSLVPVPAHHLGANPSMRRLWEARWLPLGSNGQTSLGPQHCLAALLDLCDHAGAQGGAATALCKIRLAAWQRASKAPTPSVPLCSHLIRATKSRGLPEAVGLRSPADFRGSLNCSHLVLASTQPQR